MHTPPLLSCLSTAVVVAETARCASVVGCTNSSSLSVWRSICGRSVDLILYGARANFTLHILVRCRISPWSLLNSLTPYAILVRCTLPLFFHGAKIVLFFMHTLRCCCGVSFPRLPVKGSWGTKITALVGDILALG